jgi:uncharacterized phage infection (PIP) family protein YhgE
MSDIIIYIQNVLLPIATGLVAGNLVAFSLAFKQLKAIKSIHLYEEKLEQAKEHLDTAKEQIAQQSLDFASKFAELKDEIPKLSEIIAKLKETTDTALSKYHALHSEVITLSKEIKGLKQSLSSSATSLKVDLLNKLSGDVSPLKELNEIKTILVSLASEVKELKHD